MDSGVDEELNYEEDEFEDELCKDSQSREGTQDSVTNNSNLESDDQYLQIDYLDDENLADDTNPEESVPTTSDSDGKALEKNENSNQKNVSTVKKELNSLKKSGNGVGNVTKRKKRLRPFQRRVEFKKRLTNSLCLNPWLPEYNFLGRQRQQATQFISRNPALNAKQQFYAIQSSPLPQMMANDKGYLQSPSARLGIGVSGQSFPQQSNNLTANLLGQPFNSDGSGYQVENGQVLLSRSFGYRDMNPDVFSKGDNICNPSGFDQPCGNNFQFNNSTTNGYKEAFYNENATNNVGAAVGEQEPKCFPEKREDRFINNAQYKPFQEEEKKVIMMKKEARLKRFMQDDLIKKDKLTDSGFEESSQHGSPPKVQFFEKKEKKFIIEELQKNFVSCNERGPLEKPDINKELLLRKKNPFGANLGTSNFNLATKANQNEKINGVKVERIDTNVCMTTSTSPMQQPTKVEAPAPSLTFGPIKTETEPHVKFIRTISKSFDELTFKKPKTEAPEPPGKLLPFLARGIGETFPKQLEPQLTGCIVKVLNIPPSTTTNDILALCSPIGIVMEVKLNCPKENSVVIRFAEPKFAEKFFSLYHGQKMNNYFLNVIIV